MTPPRYGSCGEKIPEDERRTGSEEEILGRVLKTKNLVDYQKDSVVSRTIINKDSGTVTLFALDKGQKISEHTVPFDALAYILDGKSKITISGEELLLGAGDSTLMPANEPHSLWAERGFKMLLVMIR